MADNETRCIYRVSQKNDTLQSVIFSSILRYYYRTYYSEIRHGDRLDNYVSNDIFGFAVSLGLTKILPIEKCFFRHPVQKPE